MAQYIHGSTDEREVSRLEKQSHFVAPHVLRHFDAAPGHRVLDLATGVGAMAARIAEAFPGIELHALELSEPQLRAARVRNPVAKYVQGDAAQMPFADGFFDRVHCSWLLEHVPDPVKILREVRRVLRPGGYCQFSEVDNESLGSEPSFEELRRARDALNQSQIASGGDPFVGPKLERLMHEAGFDTVRVFQLALLGSQADPVFFQSFIDEFAEIFESLDESVEPVLQPLMTQAAAQLRSLATIPNASLFYTGVIAQGFR